MTVPDEVLRHYAAIDEGRRISEGAGQLEFVRVQEIVRRHLPKARLSVADVGGATGVHAAWLAEDGHDVHLVDPAPTHVEAARSLRPGAGSIRADVGEATSLTFDDQSMDALLLFGPLYHLTRHTDRLRALREARRVLRPGGTVFVAAISRFASLFDGLARGFLFDARFKEIVERDLHEGQHRNPTDEPHWFTTAYFHHPSELRSEVEAAGFDVVELVGVEGLAGWLSTLAEDWQQDDRREAILFAAKAVESEPTVIGVSAHLVLVARRPSA